MSTDYGIKCATCNKAYVPDNMRRREAELVLEHAPGYAELHVALEKVGIGYIHPDFMTYGSQFMELIEFLHTHKGHKLKVINEYDALELWSNNNE